MDTTLSGRAGIGTSGVRRDPREKQGACQLRRAGEQTPEPAKRPLATAIDVEPGATCLDHGQLVDTEFADHLNRVTHLSLVREALG